MIDLTYNKLYEDIQNYKLDPKLLNYAWVCIMRSGMVVGQMLGSIYKKYLGVVDPYTCKVILPYKYDGSDILVIEDMSQTGLTPERCIKLIRANINSFDRYKIETLCYLYDPSQKFIPNYYITKSSDWIKFPWDDEIETGNEDRTWRPPV